MRLSVVAALALVLVGCGGDESDREPSGESIGQSPSKDLSQVIWQGYTQESFPALYDLVGADAFSNINNNVVRAAESVIREGMCDEVVDSSPSQSRSSQGKVVFFVDCADKSRFYISESDIKDGFDAGDKAPGDGNGNATQGQIENCRNEIEQEYSSAESIDIHVITGFGSEVGDYGVVSVRQDFTITNRLGSEERITAICRYQDQATDGSVTFTR